MQITIDFEAATGIFRVTFRGSATADGYISVQRALHERPDWKPGTGILFDNREADLKHLTNDDLQRITRHHAATDDLWGTGRAAFLMNPGLGFGLARQYELSSEERVGQEMMVFDDEDEALAWLVDGRALLLV